MQEASIVHTSETHRHTITLGANASEAIAEWRTGNWVLGANVLSASSIVTLTDALQHASLAPMAASAVIRLCSYIDCKKQRSCLHSWE